MSGIRPPTQRLSRRCWEICTAPRTVPPYAAPARATDLPGLPPAYIDVGSAGTFRDEDVAYANAIGRPGGEAELHAWPGAFDGFDSFAPAAALTRDARDARHARWAFRIRARRRRRFALASPTPRNPRGRRRVRGWRRRP
ncbi:alpha/beta hydrolase [Streptomyces virginiae]|uniref:alpha/beta hydrolase n=1 Tax=Streptomyces virginiae TaxID=1961 RepID=UPI00367AA665